MVLAWTLGQALVHLPVIRSRAVNCCPRFSMISAFSAPSSALLIAVAVLAAFPEHALAVVPSVSNVIFAILKYT